MEEPTNDDRVDEILRCSKMFWAPDLLSVGCKSFITMEGQLTPRMSSYT